MADETWDDFIREAKENFNLPPEGEYDFIITETEAKVSSAGNSMVRVKAKITSGPHAGKSIKDFYVIRMVSQMKKFMMHMKAVGITLDTLTTHKPTMDQLAKVMNGKAFRGKVVHKSDDRFGDAAELSWAMIPPAGGAAEVTSFPAISEAEALGYGSGETVAAADDAAF